MRAHRILLASLLLASPAALAQAPDEVPVDERWSPGVGPGGAYFVGAEGNISVATLSAHLRRDRGVLGERWSVAAIHADTDLVWVDGAMLLAEERLSLTPRLLMSVGAGIGHQTTHWKHVRKNRAHIEKEGDTKSSAALGLWVSPATVRFGNALQHEAGLQLMVVTGNGNSFPGAYLSVAFHPTVPRRWVKRPGPGQPLVATATATAPPAAPAPVSTPAAATPPAASASVGAPAATAPPPAPAATAAPAAAAKAPAGPARPTVGARVALVRKDGSEVRGYVSGVDEERIAVIPDGQPFAVSIPLADVRDFGAPAAPSLPSPAPSPAPAPTPAAAARTAPTAPARTATPAPTPVSPFLAIETRSGTRRVRPGERVEVTRTDGSKTTGVVTGASNGRLALVPDGAPIATSIRESEIADLRALP